MSLWLSGWWGIGLILMLVRMLIVMLRVLVLMLVLVVWVLSRL